jgi:hypothetical protein
MTCHHIHVLFDNVFTSVYKGVDRFDDSNNQVHVQIKQVERREVCSVGFKLKTNISILQPIDIPINCWRTSFGVTGGNSGHEETVLFGFFQRSWLPKKLSRHLGVLKFQHIHRYFEVKVKQFCLEKGISRLKILVHLPSQEKYTIRRLFNRTVSDVNILTGIQFDHFSSRMADTASTVNLDTTDFGTGGSIH